jgi:hypothetical protein
MRQRQPDRTDLRVLGRQAVEYAARDHEMRLSVVVAEGKSPLVIDESDRCTQQQAERGQQL